jgi:hypothetical protein
MKTMAWIAVLCLLSFGALGEYVDQGRPGQQGPWKTGAGSCFSPTHTVTVSGLAAVNCPASNLAGRRFITLCNSSENTGTPKVKIRIDGTNPAMGLTNVGDVLGVGDCITYVIGDGVVPKCISDTASTTVTGLECK